MSALVGGLCVLVLSLALTGLVRTGARALGLVASPRKDRWHSRPTALLGGVGVYVAFVTGYLAFGPSGTQFTPILLMGSLLFVTGLVDDLVEIKPYTKLVVQLVASSAVVYNGLLLPWTTSQPVNEVLTVFWLVGITNAINLLDNMDGLAGGIVVIACAFMAVAFAMNGQYQELVIPVLLAGAVLGFLIFNFKPASIFMGDCGSMFMGFVLGGAALMSDYGRSRNLTAVLLTPVLILLIPIFDTCVVTVARKVSGRRISEGGRDHTSHRLVALGMSERQAVTLLYVLAGMSGALAMTVRVIGDEVALVLVPGFALVVIFIGLYLGKVSVYEDGEAPVGNTIIRVVSDFSHKRRVFEAMLDLILVALAYYGALVLRYDGAIPAEQLSIFGGTLPLVMLIQMAALLVGGVYRGIWRYSGISDCVVIARSAIGGAAASALVILVLHGFSGPSRAVLVLNALLFFVFVASSRLSFRLLHEILVGRRAGQTINDGMKPVLIYGAGDGGELLIREILNNPGHAYSPVGFIDDDRFKAGKIIHGFKIFDSGQASDLITRHGVNEVLVSSGKVSETRLSHLRDLGVNLRRMSIRIE